MRPGRCSLSGPGAEITRRVGPAEHSVAQAVRDFGVSWHAAMAAALRRTVGALVASAITVAAGILCLLAARLAGLSGLGPVAAGR